MQEEICALRADNRNLKMQLLSEHVTAASTSQAYQTSQAQLKPRIHTIAALKRGCMLKDVLAMADNFMVSMTGIAGY